MTPPARSLFAMASVESAPRPSVLDACHRRRVPPSRLANFGGTVLPLWFTSIAEEHQAVRRAAGLFDCTHMGILEVRGDQALAFLDEVLTHDVSRLKPGRALYAALCNADGRVLDDLIAYQRDAASVLLVVNASNKTQVVHYLRQVLRDEVVIDLEDPDRTLAHKADLAVLDDPETGWVDLALQGPASGQVLARLMPDQAESLADLAPMAFFEGTLLDRPCLVARTGYTGSRTGFELLVRPDAAPAVWEALLETGGPLGLQPCGLGARDSLRIEAGLPLYGHELAGPYDLTPIEAGYAWAVRLDKPFFVGQAPLARRAAESKGRVQRLGVPAGKGIRPVRAGDAVLDAGGCCRGWILSAATVANQQVILAYLPTPLAEGTAIGVYYCARNPSHIRQGRLDRVPEELTLPADLTGHVLQRFARF